MNGTQTFVASDVFIVGVIAGSLVTLCLSYAKKKITDYFTNYDPRTQEQIISDRISELKVDLSAAIANQDFLEAARLRDELMEVTIKYKLEKIKSKS